MQGNLFTLEYATFQLCTETAILFRINLQVAKAYWFHYVPILVELWEFRHENRICHFSFSYLTLFTQMNSELLFIYIFLLFLYFGLNVNYLIYKNESARTYMTIKYFIGSLGKIFYNIKVNDSKFIIPLNFLS